MKFSPPLFQKTNSQCLIIHLLNKPYASYGSRRQVGLMDSQGCKKEGKKKPKAQNPLNPQLNRAAG
jgi:hypothetical protein